MASKPLTEEAIAMTEKKMDMTLDDINKMSKNKTVKPRKQRISDRNKNFVNNSTQDKAVKLKKFMDSRSAMRPGALAQRRFNYQRNHFPLVAESTRRTAATPICNRSFNAVSAININKPRVGAVHERAVTSGGGFRVQESVPYGSQQHQQHSNVSNKQKPQTLDSLFANMKEERMRVISRQSSNNSGRTNNAGGQ